MGDTRPVVADARGAAHRRIGDIGTTAASNRVAMARFWGRPISGTVRPLQKDHTMPIAVSDGTVLADADQTVVVGGLVTAREVAR